MQIASVSYSRLFSTGDYENEKIGATAEVEPGQSADVILTELKGWVYSNHADAQKARDSVEALQAEEWQLKSNVYQLQSVRQKLTKQLRELKAVLMHHGIQIDLPTELMDEDQPEVIEANGETQEIPF